MTVTINGTTGIAGTNGSAGTPAVQGEDTNTGIFFPAADTVAVATGGSERLRVDSAGNAGLGVTPSAWGGAFKAAQVNTKSVLYGATTATGLGFNFFNDGANKYLTTDAATLYIMGAGSHAWYTAPSGTAGNAITFTQAMSLDSSGNLLVGTTTAGFINDNGWAKESVSVVQRHNSSQTSGTAYTWFTFNTSAIGSITQSGTTGVAYNTTSDYRLKENVQPMQDALAVIAQLNPVTYTWKADGSDGQGFIAHELQAVVPDCVTGEKDAVDAEGNPQYQGIDTSFLVATLVKAVQELTARVAELENK
jgi:hypothetical protein